MASLWEAMLDTSDIICDAVDSDIPDIIAYCLILLRLSNKQWYQESYVSECIYMYFACSYIVQLNNLSTTTFQTTGCFKGYILFCL